jgi:hypothetical protein
MTNKLKAIVTINELEAVAMAKISVTIVAMTQAGIRCAGTSRRRWLS